MADARLVTFVVTRVRWTSSVCEQLSRVICGVDCGHAPAHEPTVAHSIIY